MTVTDLEGNRLLRLLPREDAESVLAQMSPVTLAFKEPIYAQGKPIETVYFPMSCVRSLVVDLEEGETVEAGTIGREGMAGLHVFLGGPVSPWRCVCQIGGDAFRLAARDFVALARGSETFTKILLRYTH